jgi:hypothetical protein
MMQNKQRIMPRKASIHLWTMRTGTARSRRAIPRETLCNFVCVLQKWVTLVTHHRSSHFVHRRSLKTWKENQRILSSRWKSTTSCALLACFLPNPVSPALLIDTVDRNGEGKTKSSVQYRTQILSLCSDCS